MQLSSASTAQVGPSPAGDARRPSTAWMSTASGVRRASRAGDTWPPRSFRRLLYVRLAAPANRPVCDLSAGADDLCMLMAPPTRGLDGSTAAHSATSRIDTNHPPRRDAGGGTGTEARRLKNLGFQLASRFARRAYGGSVNGRLGRRRSPSPGPWRSKVMCHSCSVLGSSPTSSAGDITSAHVGVRPASVTHGVPRRSATRRNSPTFTLACTRSSGAGIVRQGECVYQEN